MLTSDGDSAAAVEEAAVEVEAVEEAAVEASGGGARSCRSLVLSPTFEPLPPS